MLFPLAVLLFVLRTPIVCLLLQRGNFDRLATQGVTAALVCYLGLLIGIGLANVSGRGYFAIHNTVIPASIMSLSPLFYLLIAVPLMRMFSYAGLALSLSFTVLAGFITDILILRRKLNGLEGKRIFASVIRVVVSSCVMGLCVWFLYSGFAHTYTLEDRLIFFIKIAGIALIGFLVFIFCCFIFKSEELRMIYELLAAKFYKRGELNA
jgi:putative peptidoglycan lipid II flippase